MTSVEKWYLCGFVSNWFDDDSELSETAINDFIWFEWETIKAELDNEDN